MSWRQTHQTGRPQLRCTHSPETVSILLSLVWMLVLAAWEDVQYVATESTTRAKPEQPSEGIQEPQARFRKVLALMCAVLINCHLALGVVRHLSLVTQQEKRPTWQHGPVKRPSSQSQREGL